MVVRKDSPRIARTRCHLLAPLFSLFVLYSEVHFAGAHRFDVNNTLGSALSAECFDSQSGARNPDVTIVGPGTVLTIIIDDFSMSRTCSFSWLGTPRVTQFVVWDRNSCDNCNWKVDSSGFARKQYDPSEFQQIFPWRSSCFAA